MNDVGLLFHVSTTVKYETEWSSSLSVVIAILAVVVVERRVGEGEKGMGMKWSVKERCELDDRKMKPGAAFTPNSCSQITARHHPSTRPRRLCHHRVASNTL